MRGKVSNGRVKIGAALLLILWASATPALAQSTDEPRKPEAELPQPGTAAAGGSQPAQDLFRRLDRNRDGHLGEEELWSERGERRDWAAMDTDRDGRISPAEFVVLR
ncbi:MAG TPA: EF-hand domain-containing protein [Burkholderiales bacterium]